MERKSSAILWFSEIEKDETGSVGEKGVQLAELSQAKFPIPEGFVISSSVYFQFLHRNRLIPQITQLLSTINFELPESVMQVTKHIKKLILQAQIPDEIVKEIFAAYQTLGGTFTPPAVVLIPSPMHSFSPASFTGHHQTMFNVQGEANVLLTIREIWASLFEPAALLYRQHHGLDHFRSTYAVIIQKQIAAETSGFLFTTNPLTNDKSKIVIEAIYGLSELLQQGKVTPDRYEVNKAKLLLEKSETARQEVMLTIEKDNPKEVKVGKAADKQKLTMNQILDLALIGKELEKHRYFPQTITWAIENKKIYLLKATNTTPTHAQTKANQSVIAEKLPLLLQGSSAAPGIARGRVKLLQTNKDMTTIMPGDILVASQTTPHYVALMKKAGGIITDTGGWTSHAAMVARELGIPAVIGTEKATSVLRSGQVVTVNGTRGEVYQGGSAGTSIPSTKTKVFINVHDSHLDDHAKEQVSGALFVHGTKQRNNLSEELERVGKAMHPQTVLYQTSNVSFDEHEPNPLLGFHGTHRYLHEPEVFKRELEAIKKVRKHWTNIAILLPYVRTVKELVEIKYLLNASGLHRATDCKLWMTVETPANVVLLEKFIAVGIDGIAINVHTLTSLMLGTDRHNNKVAQEFDELNPAVLWALEQTITTAKKHHIETSLFGQIPSFYPALFERLIKWGITSIAVTPPAIEQTKNALLHYERKKRT